jgi:predicted membrane-bound mannosyltransferase
MMRGMTRSSSWPTWLIIAAITALAAMLRLWQIGESLWVDELHSSWCLQAGLENVALRAAEGNQSPLYFWLLWGVTRVLGESEFTLRLPSLLAGIALPGMAWLLAGRLGLGERTFLTAALASLLVCVDHTSIFYSTEARPYALVELASAGALIFALESLRGGIALRAALVATLVVLFYLHYTTVLYIGGLIGTFFAYSIFAKDAERGSW